MCVEARDIVQQVGGQQSLPHQLHHRHQPRAPGLPGVWRSFQSKTSEGGSRAPSSRDAAFLPEVQTHVPPTAVPAPSCGSPEAALPLLSIFFTPKESSHLC